MTTAFETICDINDIVPGTGVCALVQGQQVAIFRPSEEESVLAISNTDPFAHSNVLSRGLIAEHQGELWVASPLKKQRFNLKTGACMEDERFSVKAYPARVNSGIVEVATS
ncbi:Nitrite reductase (NAD(P)H) small subunit [Vibrio nigripulchritudo MADA3029]|uniref:Nitrite reductase (NADH) small subunit n=2 Tax=Vibrio nigripulchritudo TaxID=28173 RepID=U4KJ60_9VIBR|nr:MULTISPECIES: nitrite reductase small subunit NirD [Vibrio]EGU57532.1 nitrite reductase small subunit [Vibrio nigripulchritudo ATCC 27043]UAB73255.1 nitrite reductase small subunit NirD [Vibrio sp. SCSIO 43132]CCN50694.1 Nitrite reductase (NAD(P)H) small subunit [Vibrio nigripulchritudo MADA3020]CCN52265.1 Nitrite reductase (NAD(P)H) small subunit [Vibrio nigripulchritudo MADA3021]CCN59173.1 Nitrite reductase (NAD(P)H) small subunit [Vibrio nigripulchritudo MADA3029]